MSDGQSNRTGVNDSVMDEDLRYSGWKSGLDSQNLAELVLEAQN